MNPKFEKAVCNFIQGDTTSNDEKELQVFETFSQDVQIVQDDSHFGERLLASKKPKRDLICNLTWVPGTTDLIERLFSRVNFVLNDYRKRLEPTNLEAQIYLYVNRRFWDINLINTIIANRGNPVEDGISSLTIIFLRAIKNNLNNLF